MLMPTASTSSIQCPYLHLILLRLCVITTFIIFTQSSKTHHKLTPETSPPSLPALSYDEDDAEDDSQLETSSYTTAAFTQPSTSAEGLVASPSTTGLPEVDAGVRLGTSGAFVDGASLDRLEVEEQLVVGTSCPKSEYRCDDGQCVGLDRFCNGLHDCQDGSDEPLHCSPCNRTYYGEIGRTYELEIRRPSEDQLPYLCHLNFTAAGGRTYGELIQISFEAFSVGTFESFTADGCPDGHVTIREGGSRPATGGQWCGSAWGYTVYYSETSSVNLTLLLERMPTQQSAGYSFEFRLAYKYLRTSDARLRYGNATQRSHRGKLHSGTYCDRLLDGCSSRGGRKRLCRVQSPNYPGIYPRNVSCRYRIRDRAAPAGQHALIVLRQPGWSSGQMHKEAQNAGTGGGGVGSGGGAGRGEVGVEGRGGRGGGAGGGGGYESGTRGFRIWDQCNAMQDYIEILDGSDDDAPVLAHLCSGETIPEIISSGPELLVKFHTSPYGNPFHPLPLSYLPGFELEVEVVYINKQSPIYIEQGKSCEFIVTTFDNSSGIVESPLHSLPPNTTCHYHFRGHPREVVWISFIKYHVATERMLQQQYDGDCDVQLKLYDGNIKGKNKVPLLDQFCRDETPKLCDHSLLSNSSRLTRPCGISESYVSSGPDLTIAHSIRYGNVLYPVNFALRYEFVDLSQEGVPLSLNPCDRIFKTTSGKVYSPRITFLYGRGGQRNVKCSYHFEASDKEKLEITFNKLGFGNKHCKSVLDEDTGRYQCNESYDSIGLAQIHISEFAWPGIEIPRDCICGNLTESITISTKTARKVVMDFIVTEMNITEDYNDYYFEAMYEFIQQSDSGCSNPWKSRRLRGSSGEITVRNHQEKQHNQTMVYCTNQPWLIEPEDAFTNFLYLKIRGRYIKENPRCPTRNRIIVYAVGKTDNKVVICPEKSDSVVELFSNGWSLFSFANMQAQHSRSFVIEFLQHEPGDFVVNWMEVSKNPALTLPASMLMISPPSCPHSCPELRACISPDLWCDGLRHCPSGNDEQESNCSIDGPFPFHLLTPLTTSLATGIILLLTTIGTASALCYWRYHRRRRRRRRSCSTTSGVGNRQQPGGQRMRRCTEVVGGGSGRLQHSGGGKNVIVSVTEHTFLEFKSGLC